MISSDRFENLIIFEIANNHQGNLAHGLEIIRQLKTITVGFSFNFAIKLQYRNLDQFIHPDYQNRVDIKYVKRFRDTALQESQLFKLKEAIVEAGCIPICTPFDEDSVGWVEKHGFQILKIASCSFTDWPLLERIAETNLPVIASTAGASLDEIDQVTAFFKNRHKPIALMHCIGEYPTPRNHFQLGQISFLKKRFSDIHIGYSTHEAPTEIESVKMAIALGATLFEKHVGLGELNAYSANPTQLRVWLESIRDGQAMLGVINTRVSVTAEEIATLNALRRGVFARVPIAIGKCVTSANTFLAIPSQSGQLLANDLSKYVCHTLTAPIEIGAPLIRNQLIIQDQRGRVQTILHQVTALLRLAHAVVPDGAACEISHHYGIEQYETHGAAIISVINREYCKKLIIMLPGQSHPAHHHEKKEETFHILYGAMDFELNGEHRYVKTGEIITVERSAPHAFSTSEGVVFEEISTTHYSNDSFYVDKHVQANPKRKTPVVFRAHWLKEAITP